MTSPECYDKIIRTRKRGHEISGGLKSGLRRKGNALDSSSGSMDGWTVDEWKVVLQWAPCLADDLAALLNLVERVGRWPETWAHGLLLAYP